MPELPDQAACPKALEQRYLPSGLHFCSILGHFWLFVLLATTDQTKKVKIELNTKSGSQSPG
jgi:hypothetical protein